VTARAARISWRTVGAGALLAAAALAGTVGLVALLDAALGFDGSSNWVFPFYGLALVGLGTGAAWAAARRPDAPLVHGLLAALVAYGAVAVVVVALRLALDRDLAPVALAFNGLMAASAGILGTVAAERRGRRT
jgi:hypothetical protein